MPQFHLLLGINAAILLNQEGFNNSCIIWFIIGSISPDIDIFLGYITKQNHRRFLSHYPMMWLSIGCLLGLIGLSIFWFFIGAFIHVLVDSIDWEIYLFAPFVMIPVSFLKLDYKKLRKDGSIFRFLLNYYQIKLVIFIEVITYISFFLLIITI